MLPQFLTDNYPTEKHYFLIPRFALRSIGLYPETEPSIWVKVWAFFNFSILAYGCYAEFYYGANHLSSDVVNALDALCPVASSIMCLFKIVCIWRYRAEFKKLIERVRFLTQGENTVEKVQIKRRFFAIATRLTALTLFFALFTTTAYSVRPILKNISRYLNSKDILYETPFKMIFPDPLLTMPFYPITFVFVMWHGYITPLSFVGADGLFLGFCLYFTTLLKSLQTDLKHVVYDLSRKLKIDPKVFTSTKRPYQGNTNKTKVDEVKVCQQLSQIIERHNEIADLVAKFSSIMVEITLGHFVSSSIIIGMSLLLFTGYGVVLYLFHTCAVTAELFLYCLGGTAVNESSEELATAAYCSHWYSHGVRVQKMILLLMIRAQRNFIIRVPFFTPSLPTLTSILRFAGSLIALVKSIL